MGLSSFQEFLRLASRWLKCLAKKFNRAESVALAVLVVVIIGSSIGASTLNLRSAFMQPTSGGVFIEGVVGSSHYINPLLADTNPLDRDLVQLIFSGLTKISPGREVQPDLAQGWDVYDQGKTYIFQLREGVLWHDGEKFDAGDVVYTINVLQNDDYQGVLRGDFSSIAVEAIDDYTVKFVLPSPSAFFLTDMSVGIIPYHIFKDIPVSDFKLVYPTLPIVGTGPYAYEKATEQESVTIRRFANYYGDQHFLERVIFFSFDNERSLATAFEQGVIGAAGFAELTSRDIELTPNDTQYIYRLPQYKAVFFNQLGDNNAIKNKAVRQALAHATNKNQIISEVAGGWADLVDSPILEGFWGHNPDIKKYDFDIAKAAAVLKQGGWVDADKDGFLEKDDTRLSFTISVRDDAKSLKIAEILKSSWTAIGAEVGIKTFSASALIKDVIRPRDFEVLIFGQDLGLDSDPYVYWHSSQITDPGLALAVEFDKDIDNNLESARLATNLNQSITYYHRFQNAFADIVPAILLYQPRLLYLVDNKVKNVTESINLSSPTDRFLNISEWYIKTRKE